MRRIPWVGLSLLLAAGCGGSNSAPPCSSCTEANAPEAGAGDAAAADAPADARPLEASPGREAAVALDMSRPPDASIADSAIAGRDGACPAPAAGSLYVDASVAAGGNGSTACPFRTITAALSTATTFFAGGAGTIHLAPGTYDAALGETFPLVIPANVTVSGETAPTRNSFVIDGAGATFAGKKYTIELAGTLNYVHATDSSGTADAIVYLGFDACPGASITISTIAGGNTAAIEAFGQPSLACRPTLTIDNQTEITGSKGDGLLVSPNGAGMTPAVTVKLSAIHGNAGDGVDVLGATGSAPSVLLGDNCLTVPPITTPDDIYCNSKVGVVAATGVTVQACGDSWNHDPPTTTGSNPDYQGSVTVTGYAAAASGACP